MIEEITKKPFQTFYLFLIIFLGGWLRFAPTILSGQVINDGGMFYDMAQAVRGAHFSLPFTVSYNGLNIPFAYPPLPFYLAALLSDLFHWPLIEVFRWIPPLLSTCSILAFFLFSKALLRASGSSLLATSAFAFMPRAYTWFVMGGGISRALGQLFFILTAWAAYRAFSEKQYRYVLFASIFGALVALSHPGQFLHVIVVCAWLWLFLDRKGLPRALWMAGGAAVLSAPWWLTVVARHGIAPYLSAAQTGGVPGLFWLDLLFPTFAEEQFLTVFTLFAVIGLVVQLMRREYLVLGFLILPFLVDPRSAASIAILALALLAGVGLHDLVLPAIAGLTPQARDNPELLRKQSWFDQILHFPAASWTLGYFLMISMLGAYAYDQPLSRTNVPLSSHKAMVWIEANTSPDSSFVVLTGSSDPFGDPVNEWFPVYAERVSATTIQGMEWSLGRGFLNYAGKIGSIQTCLNADPECIIHKTTSLGIPFDFIYLLKTPFSGQNEDDRNPALLLNLLRNSTGYESVYENADVVIFMVRPMR